MTSGTEGKRRGFARPDSLWIALACTAGCVRVLLCSAALPFFTNVDEQAHFDLVHKYASGWLPSSGDDHYDRGSAELITLYGSPEYMVRPEAFHGEVPAPIWQRQAALRPVLPAYFESWQRLINHEAFSPPVYYLLAAAWYDLGRLLGIAGGSLLYWVRFLNAPIYGALIWLAHRSCRKFHPERPVLAPAMLVLLAFFPQDVFYSINADVLSPLAFALAFHLVLSWVREERPSLRLRVAAGLSVAATFLIKYSNAAVLAVLALAVAARIRRRGRVAAADRIRESVVPIGAALAPILAWLCYASFTEGGMLGSVRKLQYLGWTAKPLGALLDHPIFTPAGFAAFWSQLLKSFWRGELVWHMDELRWPPSDTFFVLSSTLFLGAAAFAWFTDRRNESGVAHLADGLALCSVAVSIAFLAFLSTLFDFGSSWYPSREAPYFTSGRLISGVMVPFSISYISGLCFLLPRSAGPVVPLAVLGVVAVVVTASDVAISLDAFRSAYNWFHLS